MTEPAFVLLRLPIQFEGAYGPKGSEDSVENIEIDVVAKIDPDANEQGEPGHDDGMMGVVEGFGRLLAFVVSLAVLSQAGETLANDRLTARKKSEISCVTYTATPI